MKPFTLVSTVFNEKRRLAQTLSDLDNQTIHPDEIIITDAGSTDGTYEELVEWGKRSASQVKILQQKGCNVAAGRNLAIRAAKNDLIVSTDFGCRFDKNWLKTITEPFSDPSVKVVGGAFGVLENDIDTLPAKAAYVMSGGYAVDVKAPWFIPSSRSIAYYREVFDKIGGYCEWLTLAADDLVYGKQIKALGYNIHTVEHKGVFWGRHKKAIGYVKEAFRYGLGDGEARVNQRSFFSNTIELLMRYALFIFLPLSIVLVLTGAAPAWLLLGNILLLPGLRSYINYTRTWLRLRSDKYNFKVFLYGFWLIERTRISYLKGYGRGVFKSTVEQKQQATLLRHQLLK
jgi:glycosyltransferase involved in cell wall biosynthesis